MRRRHRHTPAPPRTRAHMFTCRDPAEPTARADQKRATGLVRGWPRAGAYPRAQRSRAGDEARAVARGAHRAEVQRAASALTGRRGRRVEVADLAALARVRALVDVAQLA